MTEAEWLKSFDSQAMIAVVSNKGSARLWRLLAVAGLRRIEDSLPDLRSRNALAVAERFADANASVEELSAARIQAEEAAHYFADEEYALEPETRGKPDLEARYQTILQAMLDAKAVLLCVAENIGDTIARAERLHFPDLFREIFGNPFRWKILDPAWLASNDGSVRRTAQRIYDDRSFDEMPILADALEAAGCRDADILEHCRRPGEHVRGCWVLDLLLEKE